MRFASYLISIVFILTIAPIRCAKIINKGQGYDPNESFKYMTKPVAKVTDKTEASRKLTEFTANEFLTREVVKIGNRIHVAIGWALANSIMIEGDDGIIIVDTTESPDSMREIMIAFRKITSKPVKGIIFTHFHSDHIIGTRAIQQQEKKLFPNITIDIYAHETTEALMLDFSDTYDIGLKRGMRQLGVVLPKNPKSRTGGGIGPELRANTESEFYVPIPTVTYSDWASYTIAGVEIEFLHTPGETNDQTTLWLPKEKAVLPGDNIYKTFPNLYAIRGSPARDSKQWYKSLDRTRALGGKYLVGSHTQPVIGKEAVYDTLLIYRDAIKYVHDQTVRYINKGYHPTEIVEKVKLPDRVADHPHLQEHYGSVPWSVRGVYTNYLGWFSGDPRDLHPMTNSERASRMVRLVAYAQSRDGNPAEIMLQEAQKSHMNSHQQYKSTGGHNLNDDKWALEIVDSLLEIELLNEELTNVAKQIKISALRALGVEQISANGRNYYLTMAMELETGISLDRTKEARAFSIKTSPLERVLQIFCSKVDGLKCQCKNFSVGWTFADIDKTYELTLRNSVCDVLDPDLRNFKPDVHLSTTSDTFISISAEDVKLQTEIALGEVKLVSGKLDTYLSFLDCFEPVNSI